MLLTVPDVNIFSIRSPMPSIAKTFKTGVVDSVNNGIPDLWQFDSGVSFATVDLLLYDCFVANYCQGTFYTIDA